MKNESTQNDESNGTLKVDSIVEKSLVPQETGSSIVDTEPVIKEKKYNGFLRNTNRKHKENEKPINNVKNEKSSTNINQQHNKHPQQKTKFVPKNKPKASLEKDFIEPVNPNQVKEDLFSPEHLLFSHLRQKTGLNPNQFWENLYVILKEKQFNDIKRSEMSLISYAALYESTDIFETLLFDYGHLISKEEIEKSIFKISTNKDPLILQHTIKFYNKNYSPTEEFINDFINLVGKSSYREEANQLLVQWLSPIMTDNNKQNLWNTCFENKNTRLISIALQNYELNHYLRNNQNDFEEKINASCKKFSILSALTKKVKNSDVVESSELQLPAIDNIKESEEILEALKKQLPARSKTKDEESIKKPAKKIINNIEDTVNDIFLPTPNSKKKLELNTPEIIIKKKRKVV